ncbi:hypothetical protein KRX56_09280, partial [Dermabacteraceae bacterium TAE3-ERU27]|nr:hypothetical protein [Dermabacteraceae bacterium TAE3-ERU27]
MNSNRPEAPVSAARTTVDRAAPVAAGPPFVAKKGVAWATILGFLLLFAGLQFLSAGAGDSDGAPQGLPGTAESARAGQLQERFPGGDNLPAVLVYSTDGTLGTERLKAIDGSVERLAG